MERTVKQVAARVGLPERTVRYYDRIALVSPPDRSSAGYRLYGPQDEGRLRFVRQAKGLGFALDDIRALMGAAERGCCGEVVPELDRLLDEKIAAVDAQLGQLADFRDRLLAFRDGRGSSCGCREHGAFCGCLDDVPPTPGERPGITTDGRSAMNGNDERTQEQGCTCGSGDGRRCDCGGDGCRCGGSAAGPADVRIEPVPAGESRRA